LFTVARLLWFGQIAVARLDRPRIGDRSRPTVPWTGGIRYAGILSVLHLRILSLQFATPRSLAFTLPDTASVITNSVVLALDLV